MNRILLYLKNYRLKAVMAPLFKCLEAIFELLVPMAVASMIDVGIGRGDTAYILKMGAVLLVLASVGIISSLTAQWFAARAASIAATAMRYELFKTILSLDYADIDRYGTDRFLTSVTSDINQVQTGINMVLRLFMRSPFVVFGAAIMAFVIDKRMSLIFIGVIAVLSVIVFGILLGAVPFYKRVQAGQDNIIGLSKEQITGARVIRAFGREQDSREEFVSSSKRLTAMQIFAARLSAFMNPVTLLILNMALVLLLWSGAVNIECGNLSKGSLVALVNYMGQILVELVKFANLIIIISKATASDRRIEDLFAFAAARETVSESNENAGEVDGAVAAGEGRAALVELKKATFSYPLAQESVLEDISLTIGKGECIGIIGGTGSGKSTLAKLIAGLYSTEKGSISYSIPKDRISYVPQKAVMLEGSIEENLTMGRAVDSELISEALRISRAEEFVGTYEAGLQYHIEQGGHNLSGGQKQRLGIARGICMDNPLLILDDPASALDFATERALRRELSDYAERKGITLVIISQRMAMVRNADRIVVMNDGKVDAVGTHEELFAGNEIYREICLSQQKDGEVSL